MFRVFALSLCAVVAASNLRANDHREKFWPFAPEQEVPKAVPKPLTHRLADVKDQVFLSAAFGHKTEALCEKAPAQDRSACRALAE